MVGIYNLSKVFVIEFGVVMNGWQVLFFFFITLEGRVE
jgi:hypothetical protein